jgi:outer membrane protein OmpA-like peptidoglycan-associated protein
MGYRGPKALFAFCLVFLMSFLFGCAGMEYSPDRHFLYYHKELPAAERAVEAARKAGKDKECPKEFQAADNMMKDAFAIYWACRTQEAIAMANKATAKANALCPKKIAAAPPAAIPAPTVSLSANPTSIEKGKCASLTWSATNATRVSIDQGIGNVGSSGSRKVCPGKTTGYMINAMGEGGTRTASTTVNVKPPPAAPKVVDRLTVHVNFDSNKADIRKADIAELQKAIAFVKKYPGYKVSVEGHTDDRGSVKYNQTLSEKRALAVKNYLLDNGVGDRDKVSTAGYGESRPKADNKTEKGRFENRRVEILILSR